LLARLDLLPELGPYVAARRGGVRQVLAIGYQHPGRLPDEVVDAYSSPVLGTPESPRALARIITALSSDDVAAVRKQLAALNAPTLIVWGTGDHLMFKTKWAYRLADLITSTVTVHTIDGARMHFPTNTQNSSALYCTNTGKLTTSPKPAGHPPQGNGRRLVDAPTWTFAAKMSKLWRHTEVLLE
jgi:hypothetical protein